MNAMRCKRRNLSAAFVAFNQRHNLLDQFDADDDAEREHVHT